MQCPLPLLLVFALWSARLRRVAHDCLTFSFSCSPTTTKTSTSTVPTTAAPTHGIQSPGCKNSSVCHSVETALTGDSGWSVSDSLTGEGGLMMICELGTIDSISVRCAGGCSDAPMKSRLGELGLHSANRCTHLDVVVRPAETDERVRGAKSMISRLGQLSSYVSALWA